jgi:tRNA 2-thiocytidine biosynthesis protein TtcA
MLKSWERSNPGRIESIFSSIKNISPSQLADIDLFDFKNLKRDKADCINIVDVN